MGNSKNLRFGPDYAVPPGETLLETIQTLGLSQAALAHRTGRPLKTVNEIIRGKASITPDTAIQLERVLGVPAPFWNSLERNYRERLARLRESARLNSEAKWLREIPVRALIQRGVICGGKNKAKTVRELLNFFGVSSSQAWRQLWTSPMAAFRRSRAFKSSLGAVAAWLRIGELRAQRIECAPFNKTAFRSMIPEIRKLTPQPPQQFKPKLVDLCRKSGVAVVFVAELPKTHVSGVARWLSSKKALVQLSCRYKVDDHLWFTFFHEAGHILRHGKRGFFIDSEQGPAKKTDRKQPREEREADVFAQDILIPLAKLRHFLKTWNGQETHILRFAQELGIAPGIVVGRLQYEGRLGFHEFNHLKRRFDLTEEAPTNKGAAA